MLYEIVGVYKRDPSCPQRQHIRFFDLLVLGFDGFRVDPLLFTCNDAILRS